MRLLARRPVVLVSGGFLFALLLVAGVQIERAGTCNAILTVILSLVLMIPLALLLEWSYELYRGWRTRNRAKPETDLSAQAVFFCLVLSYLPMYVILFPGSFAYDVPFQLKQVFTGSYSTHHPLIHTLLMGSLVRLGWLVGHVNLGAALYTLVQILLLSLCFTRCVQSIAKQSGNRSGRAAAIFFALYPLHMLMASNATKDTLFGGTFALALCLIFQKMRIGVSNRENGRMILAIMFSILLRNNAWYAFMAWAVLGLLVLREERRRVALAVFMSTLLALGVGAGLSHWTHAASGDIVEMLSVPIQQVARVRLVHPEVLDSETKRAIDEIMPGDAWGKYDPTISDPVKFEMDSSAILENPREYLRLYASVLLKCPQDCLDAFLLLTHGFLYPYQRYSVSGYYLQTGITDQYYDDWWKGERIHDQSPFPRVRQAIVWRFGAQGAMQWPLGYLFNMGVLIWTMLYLVIRQCYLENKGMAMTALLTLFLLGTFLLGPCMAGRYVYPFVCCLPVLAQGGMKHGRGEKSNEAGQISESIKNNQASDSGQGSR